MKQEITHPSKKLLAVYRVEVAVIIGLVLILAAGSLTALARNAGGKGAGGQNSVSAGTGETAVFTGIGSLRILAGDALVIISVSFPYPAGDRPFAEELASRTGDFRSVATGYFSSLSSERMTGLDEEAAKTELLKRYNALLRLGKIETLYFTDFKVLE